MRRIKFLLERVGYHPGETIEGEVLIQLDEPLKSRELELKFEGTEKTTAYYTDSEGDSQRTREYFPITKDHQQLRGPGPLQPGEHRFPFTVKIPDSAIPSYDGRNVEIFYELKAWVDVPWGFDLEVEKHIYVLPFTPVRDRYYERPIFLGTVDVPETEALSFETMEKRGRHNTPELAVFLDKGLYYAGEKIQLRGLVTNPKGKHLRELDIKLRAYEYSKANGSSEKTKLMSCKLPIPIRSTGRRHQFEDVIRIPEDAPSSFRANNSKVVWELEIELDVAWGWDRELELDVPIFQRD